MTKFKGGAAAINKAVRNSKSGPWTVIAFSKNKVIGQQTTKNAAAVYAFLSDLAEKYPKSDRFAIEASSGTIIWTGKAEAVKEAKSNKIESFKQFVK